MYAEKARICIVTPDVIGPVKNGGVGAHAYYLARALSRLYDVTILFTGPMMHGTVEEWQAFYSKFDISFKYLGEPDSGLFPHDIFARNSLAVFQALVDQDFTHIHFQDWLANGFHSIQAKRTMGHFANTLLTVTMHSNTEWILEGSRRLTDDDPLLTTKLCWMERYCHQYCDVLISPSRHMLEWATAKKWCLARKSYVLPYIFNTQSTPGAREELPALPADPSHLAFFGRLETRKGLELFCEAVESLLAANYSGINKISFLGKYGPVSCGSVKDLLRSFARLCAGRVEIDIHTDYDSFQAVEYIRQNKAVAVIASLSDNLPYTVIECVASGIAFIAADVGGIKEIAAQESLFYPDSKSLAQKIQSLPEMDFSSLHPPYSQDGAEKGWLDFHEQRIEQPTVAQTDGSPLISVCIPYYNYGRYLEQTLSSLEHGHYDNYEVVVLNDGSTDEHSNTVFHGLRDRYAHNGRWVFESRENGGVGKARNSAAALARGEYLVFMDADNVARPDMLERLVKAVQISGADCVTCYFSAFEGVAAPDETTKAIYHYAPYGPCLEAGLCENVFGDANCIVKKSVFESLGGFSELRGVSWEDYELFVRLCLRGYILEVVPADLFWYRHTPEGFSRNTSLYLNQQRIVDAYSAGMPDFFAHMARNLILPSRLKASRYDNIATEAAIIKRILPQKSLRRKVVKFFYHLVKGRIT